MLNKIKTEKDIELFMKKVNNFHDSCIKELKFVSGTYVDGDLSMIMNTKPCVAIIFQRQSEVLTTFELRLEYVENICVNTDLSASSEIYEAHLELKNNKFYWYSDLNYKMNISEVTWFSCKTIEWQELV